VKGGDLMFFGRYDYTIDAKGRLNFPAKFRAQLGEESFVVMEWVDKCLFALPMDEVERISERLGADELMDSWEVTGDLFSTACEVEPDKQGRILLPLELRQYAGLEKNVTIIGNRNHAEIWDTDTWNARRAGTSNEQRAQRLRELHI
jgi:MraZ protein